MSYSYAGSISTDVVSRLLRPLFQNFSVKAFDRRPAVNAIVSFIVRHCRTHNTPLPDAVASDYDVRAKGFSAIVLIPKNRKSIYYVDCNNGEVFFSEYVDGHEFEDNYSCVDAPFSLVVQQYGGDIAGRTAPVCEDCGKVIKPPALARWNKITSDR